MRAFWKKGCKKQGSSAHEKGQFFSNFEFPGKMTDFAGLFWSDHLTYNNSPGISGKIISISFIWNPVFRNCASGEAAVTSGKSGLMCSAFKMLISVLSNKAVLVVTHCAMPTTRWSLVLLGGLKGIVGLFLGCDTQGVGSEGKASVHSHQ